jgi:N-acetylglucosaminyldiphosphoundecaprenol N-acetyl-beta-D-mannosaminyltransferase
MKKRTKTMTVEVMGYSVYAGSLEEIKPMGKKRIINTLNAYSFVKAESDHNFKKCLKNSDILIADGFPVVTAARFLKGEKIKKIAGEDLFFQMMKCLQPTGGSCFFLGAGSTTLEKIHHRVSLEFPNIKVYSYSPPYKPEFGEEDMTEMVKAVNSIKPDVLFVGLTAPKQEKLVGKIHHMLECGDICSIGAVFDFYAGTNKRPSKFWIKLRLEWFIRLVKEPSRLWKRYLIYSPWFFIYMIKYWFKK